VLTQVDRKGERQISFFILSDGETFTAELFVSTPLGSLPSSGIPL